MLVKAVCCAVGLPLSCDITGNRVAGPFQRLWCRRLDEDCAWMWQSEWKWDGRQSKPVCARVCGGIRHYNRPSIDFCWTRSTALSRLGLHGGRRRRLMDGLCRVSCVVQCSCTKPVRSIWSPPSLCRLRQNITVWTQISNTSLYCIQFISYSWFYTRKLHEFNHCTTG